MTFKDKAGTEWTLRVSVAGARAVLKETGVNIYALPQAKFQGLMDLLSDPYKLLDVAWVLCRDKSEISKEAFEELIDGPALEALGNAVMEVIPDFFSDRPGQENLRQLFAKAKTIAARMQAREAERIEAIKPETIDLDKIPVPENLNAPSGSGPASSESVPTVTSSGNSG